MPYLAYAFGGIKLLVYEKDAARAKEIIESNDFDSLKEMYGDDIEPQRVCPQCKSADIIQRRSILSGLFFLAFFFVPLATPTRRFICARCGHEWKEERDADHVDTNPPLNGGRD